MPTLAFRIVNVFAESALAGNPLVVVEDGRALDDATMQALALQFNVSETTFVLPSERGTARVRIFTPTFEMPFAGHPTLGTAHVVRELMQAGDRVTLELRAGLIPVRADKDVWTLTANAPRHRAPSAARSELASMLGLEAADLVGDPLWIDTGAEQLIVPLASFDAVRRAQPVAASMLRYATHDVRAMAYVFARDGERVLARFFFLKHGAVIEDPGTGSACANLGGYLLATNAALPLQLSIDQGEAVGRRCRLGLTVLPDRSIHVAGRVIEIGRGALTL
ncbi:MAG: PhzF family phenazine biosynthesis protein [Betaproteobacteria bacterium]|nr:PhzF family phenazine biosynthesis protein [Casimicrobiaceae bacterium]